MPERVYTNRYEIVRHLARGGMAEVYLAHDQLLDRRVALKVLFPEFARDPAFVQRFRREAQSAANLNHPNIVAVFDWGEEDGTYFIVMEYVEGRSLREAIQADGPLYPNLAADLASDIAGALGFAHRNGVIHRDVKPGNILLTPQGQVKVTDFGIARAGGDQGLTKTGSVMGTATYFSPEQAQGLPVDARSDVYSLGVVLYEMVCAVPPFSGESPISVAYKHVREEPPRPTVVNPDVPRPLEDIILTALAKSPEDRYPSADDMRADLARFRRGEAPVTSPVGVVPAIPVTGTEPTTLVRPVNRVDRTTVSPIVTAPPPLARRRSAAPFMLALVAMLAVLAGLGYLLARQLQGGNSGARTVTLRDFRGKPFTEAKLLLEDRGLRVEENLEINDSVPEGQIFDQAPPPGTKLRPGQAVTLTVSQGRGKVAVPDVTGDSLDDAQSRLRDAGLEVRFRQEPSNRVDQGKVIRTNPAARVQVDKGSTVEVFVSSGVELVKVPDVTGEDAVSAAAKLGASGFDVENVSESSDTVDAGKVIRTEPSAGSLVGKGSKVRLVVSSGKEQVPVPDVVGLSQSTAIDMLKSAGFEVVVQEVTGDPARNGKVIAQNPPGGEGKKAPAGSTVTITVVRVVPTSTASSSTSTTTTSPLLGR